nr:unnamed protein product [Spirometra erinaceieuropaei]
MLMNVYRDERRRIRVACMTDGQIFNQQRLPSYRRLRGDMQSSTDLLAAVSDKNGLVINTEKTVVMRQPSPNAAQIAPKINMNGAQTHAVDSFAYLDSTITRTIKIDRISKVNEVFGRLQNTI